VRFTAHVEVRLRPGIADPESATIERALPALGFDDVSSMTTGRSFRFEIESDSGEAALARAQELASRLLASPVMEDAEVSIDAVVDAR
jgi:phosphoribosylformylglycinamidine synthase subunit PurS